jgi:hypothetical protein
MMAGAGPGRGEATVIGLTGATGSGIVLNGWVFFIWTAPNGLAGGSGSTVIRAVSFLGPGLGEGARSPSGGGVGNGGATLGSKGAGAKAPAAGAGLPLKSGGGVIGFDGAGGTGV